MTSNVTISALCEAVINNDLKKIYSLYSNDEVWEKFNPSQHYRYNNTSVILLHLACSNSRYEIANYFICSEFCDVNCCDSKHRNCLHKLSHPSHGYSTQDERVKIARALLDRKCNVNAQDIEGNTPIHRAIFNQDLTMLRILLEKKWWHKVGCKLWWWHTTTHSLYCWPVKIHPKWTSYSSDWSLPTFPGSMQ